MKATTVFPDREQLILAVQQRDARIAELETERDRAQAEAAELRDELTNFEWVDGVCQWCLSHRAPFHHADCKYLLLVPGAAEKAGQ